MVKLGDVNANVNHGKIPFHMYSCCDDPLRFIIINLIEISTHEQIAQAHPANK